MTSPMNIWMSLQAWTQVGHFHFLNLLLLLVVFIGGVDCFGWNSIACSISECCDKPYVSLDMSKLREYSKNVFGQHLVMQTIESHLEAHFDERHIPPKPLVLSFHGDTGTGKNYVTKFIVKSIYKEGMDSKFVHYYHVEKLFPHKHKFEQYSAFLQKDIESAVRQCGRSIFIFDEFDHMPKGLIDRIKVYLDFHENVEGSDYRKSMFFFLGNSGEDLINELTIGQHKVGRQRENIKLHEIEHYLARHAMDGHGGSGFHSSQLIDKHLVTAYVPFLPLRQMHVKKCIKVELARRGVNRVPESWIQDILNELHFVEGFSESGCKRIQEKVAYTMIKRRNEL